MAAPGEVGLCWKMNCRACRGGDWRAVAHLDPSWGRLLALSSGVSGMPAGLEFTGKNEERLGVGSRVHQFGDTSG